MIDNERKGWYTSIKEVDNMLYEERSEIIINLLEQKNTVSTKELIKVLKVSEDTVRRDLDSLEEKFKIIICTHSLPYYKNLEKLAEDFYNLLEDDGRLYIAFASGNSFYDKLALSFVKLTTGPAYYPSDKSFRELIKGKFNAESLHIIKERSFMPRIAVYKLEKVIR